MSVIILIEKLQYMLSKSIVSNIFSYNVEFFSCSNMNKKSVVQTVAAR